MGVTTVTLSDWLSDSEGLWDILSRMGLILRFDLSGYRNRYPGDDLE